ncbi:hypothetical protein FOZ61_000508 [Perkinsus olseni]|uniref:Uncharacterized protein n=1 Tax=Perkinsus olseni TaxID=32597 RepID=A0A7J6KSB2_PEROL|nr:hypothetical protein FOZ61_000508 [Perkinsus olseni]
MRMWQPLTLLNGHGISLLCLGPGKPVGWTRCLHKAVTSRVFTVDGITVTAMTHGKRSECFTATVGCIAHVRAGSRSRHPSATMAFALEGGDNLERENVSECLNVQKGLVQIG